MKGRNCTKCKEFKEWEAFNRCSRVKSGRRSQCQKCTKKEHTEYNNGKGKQVNAEYRKNNKSKIKARKSSREYKDRQNELARSPEARAKARERYRANIEKHRKYNKTEAAKNSRRRWKRNNRGKCRADYAKYNAKKIKACPEWADLEMIKIHYQVAEMCEYITGEKYHVDHIVPLRGKNVSGLHIYENLQVLPAKENLSKGNKYG